MGNTQGNYRCPNCGSYDINQSWGQFSNNTSLNCNDCNYIFQIPTPTFSPMNASVSAGKKTEYVHPQMSSGVSGGTGAAALGSMVDGFAQARKERYAKIAAQGDLLLQSYVDWWNELGERLNNAHESCKSYRNWIAESHFSDYKQWSIENEAYGFFTEWQQTFERLMQFTNSEIQKAGNQKKLQAVFDRLNSETFLDQASLYVTGAEMIAKVVNFGAIFFEWFYGENENFPFFLTSDFADFLEKARDLMEDSGEFNDEWKNEFNNFESRKSEIFAMCDDIETQLEELLSKTRLLIQKSLENSQDLPPLDYESMENIRDIMQGQGELIAERTQAYVELSKFLKKLIETAQSISNPEDEIEQIERLAALLQRGLLTQEEFELKKKQILGM